MNPRDLPIYAVEPKAVAVLGKSTRLVLQAPTGSGKSTQMPQIMLDHGLVGEKQIVVLQPRRLATRLLAKRVAEERGVPLGGEVGYQIRLDNIAGARTRIKFVTEGILLRQMLREPDLPQIGAIFFDEFHERHLYGDITLGRALQIQRTARPDLKIVVMSATLNAGALQKYLAPCDVISSEGRTFPVEIEYLPKRDESAPWDLAAYETERLLGSGAEGDVLIFMPGAYEINRTIQNLRNSRHTGDCVILPLHGQLAAADQDAAVSSSDRRKIIVSTNVAETSLTIDGIRLVIDSGLARIARYDPHRGINTLLVEKISRASAEQRAGRAGRTAPGRCLRLWTEQEHELRPAQELPEVKRLDLAEVALTLKAAGITDLPSFPWIDAPEPRSLERAETLLHDLGALEPETGAISATGRRMLPFPVHPRYARMFLAAHEYRCVRPVALIAALTQGRSLWMKSEGKRMEEDRELVTAGETASDFFVLMRAFRYAERNNFDARSCQRLGLHGNTARQTAQLLDQFLSIARDEGLAVDEGERPASEAIQKCVLLGFSDHLAKRFDEGTLRCALTHGRAGVLARESVVQQSPLLVAAEVREIQGRDDELRVLLSLATAVEENWLRAFFPADFHEKEEVAFDPVTRRVTARKTRLFRDLVLESTAGAQPGADAAARLLALEVEAGRCPIKSWDDAVDQWFFRVGSLARWWPELGLPVLGGEDRRAMLEQICHGAFGYKDIKDRPVWPVVKGWLSDQQQRWVDEYTPERVGLPNGRKAKVTYSAEGPPVIAARIQDLYGVAEDILLAHRRVPAVIQILAPNFRPIQITQNLSLFWKESYPKIKQELQRKYPKHEWR